MAAPMTLRGWLIVLLISGLTLPAQETLAKSSATAAKPNKDFRDLIVRGERPEIAACMVAAINAVTRDSQFDALRWTDDSFDGAILRESDQGGDTTRQIHFTAQVRVRGGMIFFRRWRWAEVSCLQRDEAPLVVQLTPLTK